MSDTPRNTRSLVIGTLLALLSASCLVAFALVAGSTDYPSGPPLAAVEPTTSAPAVKLTARTKRNSDRPRVRPGRENDPTAPIVLGIQITDPEPRDGDANGNKDGRRDPKGDDRDGDGRKGSKGSRKPSTGSAGRDSDGTPGSPPQVAKPTTDSPGSDDEDGHVPQGNAYGHYKKESGSGSKGSSSSSSGGPPAHAQANGHDKQSSSGDQSSGPPAHAQSDGGGKSTSQASSKGGPPAHAQANGHDKKPKD